MPLKEVSESGAKVISELWVHHCTHGVKPSLRTWGERVEALRS